jgi:hypothetical protein
MKRYADVPIEDEITATTSAGTSRTDYNDHSPHASSSSSSSQQSDEYGDPLSSSPAAVAAEDGRVGSAVVVTVDEAIERLGMGWFQLIVLTAAGLCFAADAMQVLLLSFLGEVLRLEWTLTDDETAFITSTLFIGAIFGTLTLGPLADRKGRYVLS